MKRDGETKVSKLLNGMEIIYDDYGTYWKDPLELETKRDEETGKMYVRFEIMIRHSDVDHIEPISQENILYTYPATGNIVENRKKFLDHYKFNLEEEKAKEGGQQVLHLANNLNQ